MSRNSQFSCTVLSMNSLASTLFLETLKILGCQCRKTKLFFHQFKTTVRLLMKFLKPIDIAKNKILRIIYRLFLLGMLQILLIHRSFYEFGKYLELFENIYKKKLWISFKENALLYQNRYIIDCETSITFFITLQAALQRCSYKKVFWKYAANLQETPLPKCNFNKFALQLYWNHSSACCIFSEHFS